MTHSPFIADVTEKTFDPEVLQRSMHTLVLVDFWAAWCNPCKMLMPLLASITDTYNGEIFLAKVDTDNERNLADRFAIRSIPSVKLFKQGKMIDEFNGVIPESSIRQFIDKHKFDLADFDLQKAKDAFMQGDLLLAKNVVNSILAMQPSHKKANGLAAKIALQERDYIKLDSILTFLPLNITDDSEIKEVHALAHFAKEIQHAPLQAELEKCLSEKENIEQRYQLACYYAMQGKYEQSMENFLLVLQQNRGFKNDGARKNILSIFDLLGGSGPLVNIYRIKMSRLLN